MNGGALTLRLAVALVVGGGAAACGGGLVPGTTYEHPLLSFGGGISPAGGLAQAKHPVVGLLWTDPLQRGPDLPMPAQWLQSSVNATDDTFAAAIFRPPPPGAVVELADARGQISRLAFAEIVIFDDLDGDGTFRVQGPRATIQLPDRYLAGSANVLTYVAIPFPSPGTASPLTLPAQSGYALVNYVCQGQLSAGTHPVNPQGVQLIVQPSSDFPDVRTCRASHGP